MATKTFSASWMGQYKNSTNAYVGASTPLRSGGSSGYHSYIGFPSSVRTAINTSSTPAKIKIKFYVTNAGVFDFGAHKETYNKQTNGLPYYNYIGIAGSRGTGWHTVEITNANNSVTGRTFKSDYVSYGYQGIVFYGQLGSDQGEGYGITSNSYNFQIIVEGTWNTPPNKATIIEPAAGSVHDEVVRVKWNFGTDAEGGSQSGKVGFHNGTSWKYSDWITWGRNYYDWDISNEPETTKGQFAVKTKDSSGAESDWAYMTFFTISHNSPPSKATNLSPSSNKIVDRTQIQRFTWKHNDDGVQAGYQIAWRVYGTTTWNYIPASGLKQSTNQYHDFAANTFPNADIEWAVKTSDQQGLVAPYSNYSVFKARESSNTPTILSPTNGQVMNNSNLTVTWSSLNQMEYNLEVWKYTDYGTGARSLIWEETVASTSKVRNIPVTLENNTYYEVLLRIKDTVNQIWSDWFQITINASFIPPVAPTIELISDNESGNITVKFTNPSGGSTSVLHNDVYRKVDGVDGADWIRIAKELAPNTSFTDLTPASEQNYVYKVVAVGTNTTSSESGEAATSVIVYSTLLQKADSLDWYTVLQLNNSRDEEIEIAGETIYFAGRPKPIHEFGEHEQHELNVEWEIDTIAELKELKQMLREKPVLLYRDRNGRRMWCITSGLKITDLEIQGFRIQTKLTEIFYEEGV